MTTPPEKDPKSLREKAADAGTIVSSLTLAGLLILIGFVVAIASLKATGSSVNGLIQKVASSLSTVGPSSGVKPGR